MEAILFPLMRLANEVEWQFEITKGCSGQQAAVRQKMKKLAVSLIQ